MSSTMPTFDDVLAAAQRLKPVAHRTPVLTSSTLNQRLNGEVYFKCENFQRIGAFKFRGGYNALASLSPEQRRAGVVAFSSGNHAQAVALAARLLGMPATIIMNSDAPAAKLAATRGYGANVVEYDRLTQDRAQIAQELVEREGLTLIPPFGHADVIAGQGTAARELLEDVPDLQELYVPLGGGGLLSGCLLAAHAMAPDCKVYGVEPQAGNDAQQSLRRGEIVKIAPPSSIADGALTQALAPITFDIIRRHVADIVTATDPELVDALRFFAERMKIVAEPTGCLGAAAVMRQANLQGRRVGVVISGGSGDLGALGRLLA